MECIYGIERKLAASPDPLCGPPTSCRSWSTKLKTDFRERVILRNTPFSVVDVVRAQEHTRKVRVLGSLSVEVVNKQRLFVRATTDHEDDDVLEASTKSDVFVY